METKIRIRPKVHFTVDATLTEGDLRALDALAGYGTDSFLEVFYKHMGKHYLQPHEKDLRSLFEKIKSLSGVLDEIDRARKSMKQVPDYEGREIHA